MNKKYDNNNIIIASRAYFLQFSHAISWCLAFPILFFAIMNPFVWHYFPRSIKLECNSRIWEFFEGEGGADYPAPWPDNPAWHFFPRIFLVAVNNLIYRAKFVLPYNLILDLLSVTRVHMLIPMLSLPLSHRWFGFAEAQASVDSE
jgi:hypothetical protein